MTKRFISDANSYTFRHQVDISEGEYRLKYLFDLQTLDVDKLLDDSTLVSKHVGVNKCETN